MSLRNTTNAEDGVLTRFAALYAEVLDVVKRLDEEISAWQSAAGVDDPGDLSEILRNKDRKIAELEGAL